LLDSKSLKIIFKHDYSLTMIISLNQTWEYFNRSFAYIYFLFSIIYHIQVLYLRKSQTRQLAVIKFAYKQNSSFCVKSLVSSYVLPKKSCVLSRCSSSPPPLSHAIFRWKRRRSA